MKKYLLVATITLGALFNVENASSQGMGGPGCPQKELVKRFTEFQDSVARFLTNLKNTTDAEDYASFEGVIETDSTEAFNVFGSRSTGLKDSMNALIDSLDNYVLLLHSEIDPYNLMSVAAFYDTLSSRITCFLADSTINTLEYLFEQCYGTGTSTNRFASEPGECENAFEANLVSARNSYQTGLTSCIGAVGCTAGFWRLVCLATCYMIHNAIYNSAKVGYICVYMHCRHLSCPF